MNLQFYITCTFNNNKYCSSTISKGFPGISAGKESTCNAGDLSWIPGLGRPPREGNGHPLQHSGLENPMDCMVVRSQRVGRDRAAFTTTDAITTITQYIRPFEGSRDLLDMTPTSVPLVLGQSHCKGHLRGERRKLRLLFTENQRSLTHVC